jgi:hypothetical protein
MWRDVDPREPEHERPALNRGGRVGTDSVSVETSPDTREVLTRDLDLPRGPRRERFRQHGREYELRGSEVRTLAAAGTFRVVAASDLRDGYRDAASLHRDLLHLREQGLITTTPYVVGHTRTALVTLTARGRDVLDAARRERSAGTAQCFYAGVSKPRELAHDVRIYRAYERAVERLAARGARVRRVVLEEELKRDYQRFLQANNRGRREATGRPDRTADEIAQWAREHQLACHDGHVDLPDLRLEYEERDGRHAVEDVEVTTPHYRGRHAAAKARAGFTCYRAVGARLGGSRGGGASRGGQGRRGRRAFDPRVAEELLS